MKEGMGGKKEEEERDWYYYGICIISQQLAMWRYAERNRERETDTAEETERRKEIQIYTIYIYTERTGKEYQEVMRRNKTRLPGKEWVRKIINDITAKCSHFVY